MGCPPHDCLFQSACPCTSLFVRLSEGAQGNYAAALESFLGTSPEATFDFLEAALSSPHTPKSMAADLWRAIRGMVDAMLVADALSFARLVLKHFPFQHKNLIERLTSNPEMQYR